MTAKKPGAHYFRGPIDQRLEYYSIPEPNSGCILWIGALSSGYGCVGYQGRIQKAHVIAYELTKGPVPKNLELDHLCRVRCCVNPDHLEPVTRQINILRGTVIAATKARCAAQTHCKRGHEFTLENTYITKNGRRSCRTCHAAWQRTYSTRAVMPTAQHRR